jgi:hypothetical protein
LIGGILAWINRRGGCTSRSNKRNDAYNQDDYTIDMNQNDFGNNNHSAAAAAAAAAAATGGAATGATQTGHSTEPLSPFDNSRRFVAAPALAAGAGAGAGYAAGQEPYMDYHNEGYSQGDYSQDGYDHGYNNQPQGADYGYYDANNAAMYNQQYVNDSQRHEYYDPGQQKHYLDGSVTSPTMSAAGNISEGGYSADKPNLKDYNSKPNEM